MNNIFEMIYGLRYNLRSQTEFLRSSNTSQHGLNFLRVFNSKVWNITTEIKNSATLNILKEKIRKWKSKNCNYKLCLRYIQKIGYINVI